MLAQEDGLARCNVPITHCNKSAQRPYLVDLSIAREHGLRFGKESAHERVGTASQTRRLARRPGLPGTAHTQPNCPPVRSPHACTPRSPGRGRPSGLHADDKRRAGGWHLNALAGLAPPPRPRLPPAVNPGSENGLLRSQSLPWYRDPNRRRKWGQGGGAAVRRSYLEAAAFEPPTRAEPPGRVVRRQEDQQRRDDARSAPAPAAVAARKHSPRHSTRAPCGCSSRSLQLRCCPLRWLTACSTWNLRTSSSTCEPEARRWPPARARSRSSSLSGTLFVGPSERWPERARGLRRGSDRRWVSVPGRDLPCAPRARAAAATPRCR